jgi:hypothetical protein
MKQFFFFFFLLAVLTGNAQENVPVTNQISVVGKIKNKVVFSLKDAKDYTVVSVDSMVIYNHLQQRKRSIKSIKGVLLKDILNKAVVDEKSPKLLSEYYFTCVSADGYKVVFSWNEIFNTEVGNYILIVTEAGGIKGDMMPERMLLLSAADIATGRRYMKGVEKIIVERLK